MSKIYPVIISGAGPVGLLTANLLGSRGIETLLIERRKSMYTYARAVGIDDEAIRALQAVDLATEFVAKIQYNPTIEYLSKNGYTFFSPSADIIPYGYPILTTFFQPDLERILREGLKRYPSVTFIENCALEEFEDDGTHVYCKVLRNGKSEEFISNYLLACDGGRSTVRKQLKLSLDGDSESHKWLVVDTKEVSGLADHIQKQHDTYSDRPMVTISLPNELRRFECKINEGEELPSEPDAQTINELFRPFIGQMNLEIVRSKVYDRYYRYAKTMQKGNVFLLGDAAHLVPPYGGQGLCSGMRDAINLSWKIADVVQATMDSNILKSYEQERIYHMEKTVEFVKKVAKKVENTAEDEPATTTKKVTTTTAYQKMKPVPKFEDGLFLNTIHAGSMIRQPKVSYLNKTVLFDAMLTFNYAIITWESNVDLYLSDDTAHFWEQLHAQKIQLYDQKERAANGVLENNSNCIFAAYEDWNAYFPTKNHVIILRPDRFILAACTLETLNATTQEFKDMCGIVNFNTIEEL